MSYPVRQQPAFPAVRRDPFAALEAVQERLNRLVGDVFTGYRRRTPLWHPDVEVSETDDGWMVEVRLPGVAPDDVVVELTDRELIVRARGEDARAEPAGDGGDGQQPGRFARRAAAFSYRLTVPAGVEADRITATMENGLLRIALPRSTTERSRRIEVRRPAGTIEGSSEDSG